MSEIDFRVEDHGTIALVTPVSVEAKQWLEENVPTESWQWHGDALAVEPRYVEALMDGAMDDGLTVGVEL